MFAWVKEAWRRVVAFHKSRLIISAVDATREQVDLQFKVQFDDAKRASDFIGMIVRLAFALFATLFLFKLAETEPWYFALPLSFAAMNCALLMYYLASKMSLVIFLYFASDAHPRESRRSRIFFLMWSWATMIVLFYAIWRVVSALAKESALLAA